VAQQTDTIDRLPHASRVAVIRLRSLGDCILCTPALELLRRYRPDLQIAVVAEDRFAEIFDFPVLPPRVTALRNFAPALCLNLHGGSRSARLTLLSGAGLRAGFDIFRPAWVYNTPIPTAQQTLGITRRVHTAEHQAAAVFYLGVPITEIPRAHVPAPGSRSEHAPPSSYAVIHPFAATHEKTWPAANFLAMAAALRRDHHLEPVFIGGAGDDVAPFSGFRTVTGAPIRELARLMRDASFFLGNDSGPAHLAAAFGLPQVVLFGLSDAEIWSPWQTPNEVLRAIPISSITIDQVRAAAEHTIGVTQ
jgi:ADP-heptose:LPS heptosyltransferase